MKRLGSILVAFSIAASVSFFLATLILPAVMPSLMYQVAPYACPEGSEAVVYHTETYEGISTDMLCQSPMAEWERDRTAGGILWVLMTVPLFLLISMMQFAIWGPARNRESDYVDDISPFTILLFQGIWGILAVGGVAIQVIHEQVTDPLDNPSLMFLDENLSDGIDKMELTVGKPIHAGEVIVRIDGIKLVRLFTDEPEAAEDITFDEGEVLRDRKHKNHFGSRSFLVSEVPWKRIPSFVTQAIDAAELDSGRISRVKIDRNWSRQGMRIQVDVKGFEYEATIVFDQTGDQISIDKELQEPGSQMSTGKELQELIDAKGLTQKQLDNIASSTFFDSKNTNSVTSTTSSIVTINGKVTGKSRVMAFYIEKFSDALPGAEGTLQAIKDSRNTSPRLLPCMEFAYSVYGTQDLPGAALRRAKKNCTKKFSVELGEYLLTTYPEAERDAEETMDTVLRTVNKNGPKVGSRLELVQWVAEELSASESPQSAAAHAMKLVAKRRKATFKCVGDAYPAYSKRYGAEKGIEKALARCK